MTNFKNIGLCTFPDDDKDYCKYFEVPKDWLVNLLNKLDSINERKGVDLSNFLDNYVWDETWLIYLQAKQDGCCDNEKEEM